MNRTYGTDIVKLWLAAQMGFDWFDQLQPENPERHGWVLIPPKRGTLKAIKEKEMPDFVKRYIRELDVPKNYEEATMSIDRVASFVVAGSCSDDVNKMLNECISIAEEVIEWN